MKTKYVQITNEGEIDLQGLHLMGISSKRGDESKIGFFGSGNKYAIATLLREKIPFKIYSGKTLVNITTEKVMFRGQTYNQICIDGEKTSLTTSMGPDWENWFAIREMYCNAEDEGGAKISLSQTPKGKEGYTTIFVKLDEKLESFFENINNFILIDKTPKLDEVTTHYGKIEAYSTVVEQGIICYRKGIRIFPENKQVAMFRYNFDKIEINESRMYKYEHEVLERIASYLAVTENQEIVAHYLANWKGAYEKNAKWEYVHDQLSETWHEILKDRRVYPESIAIDSGDYEGKHNSFIVPDELAKKISNQFDDVQVVGYTKGKEFTELKPTREEKIKIDTAKQELSEIGYIITSEIVLCETKQSDVIGWYESEADKIYLTRKHLGNIPHLKNTLLEEHFHSLGHQDGQRAFVTFLIDELIEAKK